MHRVAGRAGNGRCSAANHRLIRCRKCGHERYRNGKHGILFAHRSSHCRTPFALLRHHAKGRFRSPGRASRRIQIAGESSQDSRLQPLGSGSLLCWTCLALSRAVRSLRPPDSDTILSIETWGSPMEFQHVSGAPVRVAHSRGARRPGAGRDSLRCGARVRGWSLDGIRKRPCNARRRRCHRRLHRHRSRRSHLAPGQHESRPAGSRLGWPRRPSPSRRARHVLGAVESRPPQAVAQSDTPRALVQTPRPPFATDTRSKRDRATRNSSRNEFAAR
jgi:hypothetical protein